MAVLLCLLLLEVVAPSKSATTGAAEAVESDALPSYSRRWISRKVVEEDLEPPPKDGPTLYVGGGNGDETEYTNETTSGPSNSNSTNSNVDDPYNTNNNDDPNTNDDPESNWIYCPQVYMPVYCTLEGLKFSNLCEATAAGYTPDNCTVEWENPDLDRGGMALQTQCSNDTAVLVLNGTQPVLSCGSTSASYPSVCWASAAGRIPADECTEVDNDTALDRFPSKCAFKAARPLRCGGNGTRSESLVGPYHNRTFLNLCFARAMGFRRINCTRTTDPPPEPTPTTFVGR